jgi:polyisoprenoid-binding protein YceI
MVIATSLDAQQAQVKLDSNRTKINFTVGDVLHTVHGSFQLRKGDLWFDTTSLKAGGKLVVDGASGTSGNHARDSRMEKKILETEIYPEITFQPDRINGKVNFEGRSEFKLHGIFTIHGATHELTMNVKADVRGNHLTATADFEVPYVRWGLRNPSTLFLRVSDTVPIEIMTVGEINYP